MDAKLILAHMQPVWIDHMTLCIELYSYQNVCVLCTYEQLSFCKNLNTS